MALMLELGLRVDAEGPHDVGSNDGILGPHDEKL